MKRHLSPQCVLSLGIALTVTAMITGCSGKTESKVGQAVARVDDYEVTVHQLNGELKNVVVSGTDSAKIKTQALEALIERQLLIAEAQRAKIDRDPAVLQEIERLKGQLLTQALMRRKVSGVTPPTASEVEAYYQKNPALFAKRKAFEMRQIAVPADALSEELKTAIDSGKSIDELADLLDSRKLQYAKTVSFPTTADLPPNVVQGLDNVVMGRPFIIKNPDAYLIASLHFIKDTPITLNDGKPQIEQFLLNEKLREAVLAEVAKLRSSAKIEYLTDAVQPAKSEAIRKVSAKPEESSTSGDYISKGVKGLK